MDEMNGELEDKMTQNSVSNMVKLYLHHANKTTKIHEQNSTKVHKHATIVCGEVNTSV